MPESGTAVVRLLDEVGAVLVTKLFLGALTFDEAWHGGKTRNPWNLEEGSSGSSTGSVAAVTAGCIGFAIGSETLGSIISPADRCGTVGLRPTFGRIPRSAEDSALILQAPDRFDPSDPGSATFRSISMPAQTSRRLWSVTIRPGLPSGRTAMR